MLCKSKLSAQCIILYSITMIALASSFSALPSHHHHLPSKSPHPSINADATKPSVHKTTTTLPMAAEGVPTLTEDTTWRLRFALNNVPTKNGRTVGELFVVHLQFTEDEGFEPPQGSVRQVFPDGGGPGEDTPDGDTATRATITSGRWKLSEDPDDRKDGLWIWGLFAEPLYPYMLLQIETGEVPIAGGAGGEDFLKPLVFYAQVDHRRDKKTGEVELGVAALNLREIEQMKADPFGAAKVEVFEEVKVGQLTFRPYDAAEARK